MGDNFFPVPTPSSPPDEGDFFYPAFGAQWLPVILAKLQELQDPALWESPPDDLIPQLDELMERLMTDNRERLPRVIGEIAMFSFYPLPDRWVECDGGFLSRTTYADLFDIIGTTWGSGDGTTTFGVPSFIHRSPYGSSSGGASLGTIEGSATHVLTTAELPAHNHNQRVGNNTAVFRASGGSAAVSSGAGTGGGATRQSTDDAGSGNAHSILHPVMHVVFGIYTGVLA